MAPQKQKEGWFPGAQGPGTRGDSQQICSFGHGGQTRSRALSQATHIVQATTQRCARQHGKRADLTFHVLTTILKNDL